MVNDNDSKQSDRKNFFKFSGGPIGLGDPNDKTLIALEKEIYIPRILNDKCNNICTTYIKALDKCVYEKNGILAFFCRKEKADFVKCINECYNNKSIIDECTNKYLKERSQYREDGIPRKRKYVLTNEMFDKLKNVK
ncbi:COX assembly mitochondrial protein [Intoshia linei]|uniref:COX assembly mitochondrial protein n=1 Tax=Intoshia linei TaxID=1819745 RepID=A0A177AZ44_9BILA|nr:COX assembly mitochondrial protein [Intoshia linei]